MVLKPVAHNAGVGSNCEMSMTKHTESFFIQTVDLQRKSEWAF